MPFAEVIFEDGSHSVVFYADEEEIQSFLTEHQQRALDGRPGAPQDQVERTDISPEDFTNLPPLEFMKSRPASRIYQVLEYGEVHPMEQTPTTVNADQLKTLIDGMAQDGEVDPNQLVSAVRDEVSTVYPVDQGPRESIYKAEATGEMDLSFLPTEESSTSGGEA